MLLDITWLVEPGDMERVRASGPVVAVANHPSGMLEGVIPSVLGRVRRDIRLMANSLVPAPPQLRDKLILVNAYGGPDAWRENRRPLRAAVEWLRASGLLIVLSGVPQCAGCSGPGSAADAEGKD